MNKPFAQIRRDRILLSTALALALGAALVGCGPQEDLPMAPPVPTTKVTIPALDAAAPAHVETATFALG